jgi:hypothetical protein
MRSSAICALHQMSSARPNPAAWHEVLITNTNPFYIQRSSWKTALVYKRTAVQLVTCAFTEPEGSLSHMNTVHTLQNYFMARRMRIDLKMFQFRMIFLQSKDPSELTGEKLGPKPGSSNSSLYAAAKLTRICQLFDRITLDFVLNYFDRKTDTVLLQWTSNVHVISDHTVTRVGKLFPPHDIIHFHRKCSPTEIYCVSQVKWEINYFFYPLFPPSLNGLIKGF